MHSRRSALVFSRTSRPQKAGGMPTQSPCRIELTEEQRAILDERARAHTAPYWEVVRARIVLLAAEGTSNKGIGARLDTSPQTVCKWRRSEEHTSELQSRQYLVCRLLLEKKKNK